MIYYLSQTVVESSWRSGERKTEQGFTSPKNPKCTLSTMSNSGRARGGKSFCGWYQPHIRTVKSSMHPVLLVPSRRCYLFAASCVWIRRCKQVHVIWQEEVWMSDVGTVIVVEVVRKWMDTRDSRDSSKCMWLGGGNVNVECEICHQWSNWNFSSVLGDGQSFSSMLQFI